MDKTILLEELKKLSGNLLRDPSEKGLDAYIETVSSQLKSAQLNGCEMLAILVHVAADGGLSKNQVMGLLDGYRRQLPPSNSWVSLESWVATRLQPALITRYGDIIGLKRTPPSPTVVHRSLIKFYSCRSDERLDLAHGILADLYCKQTQFITEPLPTFKNSSSGEICQDTGVVIHRAGNSSCYIFRLQEKINPVLQTHIDDGNLQIVLPYIGAILRHIA